MDTRPSGQPPGKTEQREIDSDSSGDAPANTRFGDPDDWRRLRWAINASLHTYSDDGVDWNVALDEAEARGIDRRWAHRETIRDLRNDAAHLHEGNIHPHYRRINYDDVLYDAYQRARLEDAHRDVDTALTGREATELSLFRMLATASRRTPASVEDLLDRASEHGMDWLWAWEVLRRWLDRGLVSQTDKERVEVTTERWPL